MVFIVSISKTDPWLTTDCVHKDKKKNSIISGKFGKEYPDVKRIIMAVVLSVGEHFNMFLWE